MYVCVRASRRSVLQSLARRRDTITVTATHEDWKGSKQCFQQSQTANVVLVAPLYDGTPSAWCNIALEANQKAVVAMCSRPDGAFCTLFLLLVMTPSARLILWAFLVLAPS